jgi:hypothetical protein
MAGRTSQSYSEATEGWVDTARKAVKDVTQKATDGTAYVQDQLTGCRRPRLHGQVAG